MLSSRLGGIRAALFFIALLSPSWAMGQGAIIQSGPAAPGQAAIWIQNGYVGSGGPATGGGPGVGLSELNVTPRGTPSGPDGTPVCINDGPTLSGANVPLPYHRVCLSANSDGGGLLYFDAVNGAAVTPLQFKINGTIYTIPGSGSCLGCGTMAAQNANSVAITGGAIDGTVIGGSTPAAGSFTTLNSSGLATLNSLALGTALPLASGGTSATTAAGARTALGLGTAAVKAASGSGGTVASVTGAFTATHGACIADSNGTIQDCGNVPGSGTVSSVATGTGLTGGTITSTGTISLASIASHDILSNITGGSASPLANTLTATIDAAIGSTRGAILERGSSAWGLIAPGNFGTAFAGNGSGADPSYQSFLPQIATVTALRAATTLPTGGVYYLGGFNAPGDGGQGVLSYVATDTTSSDNACTIFVDASSHRWYRDLTGNKPVSPRACGASGSAQTTTGTVSLGSATTLSLLSALDFSTGQGVRIDHVGAAFTASAPTSLAVSNQGATGSTTYAYQISSLDNAGGVGAAVASVTTTSGNTTLSTTNYNQVTWTFGANAPAAAVWRSTSGGAYSLIGVSSISQVASIAIQSGGAGYLTGDIVRLDNGVLGTVTASAGVITAISVLKGGSVNTAPSNPIAVVGGSGTGAAVNLTWQGYFSDVGASAATPTWVPATPPGSALADQLVTTISAGGGTTTLTLAAGGTTAGTGVGVYHDDTATLASALATGLSIETPPGDTYQISGGLTLSGTGQMIFGGGRGGTVIQPYGNFNVITGTSGLLGEGAQNLRVDATNATGGFAFSTGGANHNRWANLQVDNPWGVISINGTSNTSTFDTLRANLTRGARMIELVGSGSSKIAGVEFQNLNFASISSTPSISIVWDGNVHTVSGRYLLFVNEYTCLSVQNTVNGAGLPSFLQVDDLECNPLLSEGLAFLSGSFFDISKLFNQGASSNSAGLYVAPGVGPLTIDDTEEFGWGRHGMEIWGNNVSVTNAKIYGNSKDGTGTYDGVFIGPTAQYTSFANGSIGGDASLATAFTQKCGVEAAPGAVGIMVTGVSIANNGSPFCDNSGGVPGANFVVTQAPDSAGTPPTNVGNAIGQPPAASPSVANIVASSQDLTTSWSCANTTETANSTTDPFGAGTGQLLAENSTSTVLFGCTASPTLADNSLYQLSAYVKPQLRSYAQISFINKNNANSYVIGTLIGSGLAFPVTNTPAIPASSYIQPLPNGWYRISAIFDSASGATAPKAVLRINGTSGTSQAAYAGTVGDGIYFGGFDVNLVPAIATTTGTVTTGSYTMTVASGTGLAAGQTLAIAGAGASGAAPFFDIIGSVSGTTVNLVSAVPTGVTTAAVTAFVPQIPGPHIATGATTATAPAGSTAIVPYIQGHPVFHQSIAPTVATGSGDCGTAPAVTAGSTDALGRVTVGSSTNGSKCTITFNQSWTVAPVCSVFDETTSNLQRPVVTQTTLAITGTLVAADSLSWRCAGFQ